MAQTHVALQVVVAACMALQSPRAIGAPCQHVQRVMTQTGWASGENQTSQKEQEQQGRTNAWLNGQPEVVRADGSDSDGGCPFAHVGSHSRRAPRIGHDAAPHSNTPSKYRSAQSQREVLTKGMNKVREVKRVVLLQPVLLSQR